MTKRPRKPIKRVKMQRRYTESTPALKANTQIRIQLSRFVDDEHLDPLYFFRIKYAPTIKEAAALFSQLAKGIL